MNSVYRESRATLLLAIPITIGQVGQMLMGITDSVMIGRTGAVPLAASSFGVGVFNIFFIVGVGLLTPVAVFASRARGAGRHDEAGEFLRHGLALALGSGAIEVALILLIGEHLDLFRQPPEVLAAVNPFFLLLGLSLVPVLAYLALRQFAESMGRPWVPMLVILGGVALNASLNWVFIYGHLGAPRLGLTGAGISTLISRTLGSAAIFTWLRLDPAMRAAWPRRWFAPLSRDRLRQMLEVGLPASGSLLFESGAFGAATIMMGWLGAVALAAHQIALSCAALTFMFSLGLSMAVGMRISAAVGAGEHSRLRPIWVGSVAKGTALSVAAATVFLLYGRAIAHCFIDDPAVVSTAAVLLIVAAIFQVFDGGQVINSAALRGLTDVRVPAVITFVAYWVIALPLGYVLGIRGRFGPAGIWIGLAAGLAVAAVLLGLRFVSLTRRGAHCAA
ncbi:MAG TPA: MATE family efflux transporter [Opitutaceae bacterium]|nr:MATE family efflux transporter [Opitutaceae bacterium]